MNQARRSFQVHAAALRDVNTEGQRGCLTVGVSIDLGGQRRKESGHLAGRLGEYCL